ncbi:hypothetical protein GARC_2396 [Paraglaciecola arctica BSs20135]|uniref:Uncharacterized protein n=1 Tax=Paraglaciecola arctica BSs20135 TaxID=493475 RepID=K6YMG9_9ALTE|nr:hypothetical protein GARC_2396 [Paraglaciecola arctica BSs20135]
MLTVFASFSSIKSSTFLKTGSDFLSSDDENHFFIGSASALLLLMIAQTTFVAISLLGP